MARLTSEFWVAAYLRRVNRDGVVAVMRRRGAAEAGAVLLKLDCLDGRAALFGPAPGGDPANDRCFLRLHESRWIDPAEAEARLARAIGFDADVWILEIESRAGDPAVEVI